MNFASQVFRLISGIRGSAADTLWRMERKLIELACLLLLMYASALQCSTAFAASENPIRVLVFSGQNNHDWTTTTPKLRSVLTSSDRFIVDVTEHPEACDAAAFSKYDVLLSNWNTFGDPKVREWPAQTREAFLNFIREGHGLVIVHAGSSSFADWEEYQKLVGGRWGDNTGHGPVHRFEVKMADLEHPITRGLVHFQTTDELWHRMATQPGIKVLATAFSAKEQGGSGNDEPVVFVTEFGKGRCFNLELGHDTRAMEARGFYALLQRGTEWAATGRVTVQTSSAPGKSDIDSVLKAAASYRFGENRSAIRALEDLAALAASDAAARQYLASSLAGLLASDATTEAKQVFCTQLSLVGAAAEVPALARLLPDTNLTYYARLALERIGGEEALRALEAALATTSGQVRIGIINSLAAGKSQQSVPELSKLLQGTDPDTVEATVWALGQMGGTTAAEVLNAAESKVPPAIKPRLAEAQLRCAESILRAENREQAARMLEKLTAPAQLPQIRMAAFPLHAFALGNQGALAVLSALESPDRLLRAAAIQTLRSASSSALLEPAAHHLGALLPECQVQLLALLAERQVTRALPEVTGALSSKESPVREAAIAAIGSIGNASSVPVLLSSMATASTTEQQLLLDSLARLPGDEVDDALIGSLKGASAETRSRLVQVLVARGSMKSIPALTQAAEDKDAQVRQEAVKGLGRLADANSCTFLIHLLGTAEASERPAIESALGEICRRIGSSDSISKALAQAAAPQKLSLLNVLAAVGGSGALEALRGQLGAEQEEVRSTAVRILAEWPDDAAFDDLVSFASSTPDARLKALALRGVARLAPQAKSRSADQLVGIVNSLLPGAATNEQKALLGALGEVPSLSAAQAAAALLRNPQLAEEAGNAVLKVLDEIGREKRVEARSLLEQVKSACRNGSIAEHAAALELRFGDWDNLSLGATATNLDGLAPDGEGGPPQTAIDGNPKTYWDEVDNQKLYILRVNLRHPSQVVFLRIMGWAQHNYAPKDFEVLCDDKVAKRVGGAEYKNNWLTVELPQATTCSSVELRITGYYGASPAIRELEIYGK